MLGTDSDDIDFTFSDVSGRRFAIQINEVLQARGKPTTDLDAHAQRAAKQSEHLETVCIGVAGLNIDLNALRRESYSPDSRIPEISRGTLLEDALRRDLTINALFYRLGRNAAEDAIEDPTGNGLRDLRAGLVRTNVDPVQSFSDDPLRLLRCVRYATRYGFRMETETRAAFDCAAVRRQFRTLVSRQLVMRELFKMLLQVSGCVGGSVGGCVGGGVAGDVMRRRCDASGGVCSLEGNQACKAVATCQKQSGLPLPLLRNVPSTA
jgi:tRNA nucleotidyltransferase (CCA-adding enzyme)